MRNSTDIPTARLTLLRFNEEDTETMLESSQRPRNEGVFPLVFA